jgi:hypothetical protein
MRHSGKHQLDVENYNKKWSYPGNTECTSNYHLLLFTSWQHHKLVHALSSLCHLLYWIGSLHLISAPSPQLRSCIFFIDSTWISSCIFPWPPGFPAWFPLTPQDFQLDSWFLIKFSLYFRLYSLPPSPQDFWNFNIVTPKISGAPQLGCVDITG